MLFMETKRRMAIMLLLMLVTTTIVYGSPNKANSYSVHGAALGTKEVDATRKNLAWPYEPFHVPEDVKKHWSRHVPDGAALEAKWNAKFVEYEKKYIEEAAELKSIVDGVLPAVWEKALPTNHACGSKSLPIRVHDIMDQQCQRNASTRIEHDSFMEFMRLMGYHGPRPPPDDGLFVLGFGIFT